MLTLGGISVVTLDSLLRWLVVEMMVDLLII
jgi:hypothetical protein